MNGVDPMLRAHISMGKNTGLTDNQINEALSIAKKNAEQYASIFPGGNPGPSEWFTGIVNVQSLVNPDQIEDLYSVSQVTFSPGARTYWHTHPAGQVLLVGAYSASEPHKLIKFQWREIGPKDVAIKPQIAAGEYIVTFVYPGFDFQISKDQLIQDNARIWLGEGTREMDYQPMKMETHKYSDNLLYILL